MIKEFFFLLPCMVCIVWAVILLTTRHKSKSKQYLTTLAVLGFFFFYYQAMFAGFPMEPENYPTVNIIRKVVSLLLFPAGILYIFALTGRKTSSPMISILMMPPVVLGGALAILYRLMGPETRTQFCAGIIAGQKPPVGFEGRIFDIYEMFSHTFYQVFLYAWFALSIFLLIFFLVNSHYRFGDLRLFIFKGKESLLVNAIIGCCMMLTGSFLICNLLEPLLKQDSPAAIIIFIFMALLLFFFFYLGTIFDETTVFWQEIFNPKKTWERKYLESHPEIAEIKRVLDTSEKKNTKGFSIQSRFVLYVEEQEPYLNPDVTIEEVASQILVDKDRLAKVIKESTGLNFRNYMNMKRVEEAKKIMTLFPTMSMNHVAKKAGFTSNSTFSRKFNEIEGMSPTEWVKTVGTSEQNQ